MATKYVAIGTILKRDRSKHSRPRSSEMQLKNVRSCIESAQSSIDAGELSPKTKKDLDYILKESGYRDVATATCGDVLYLGQELCKLDEAFGKDFIDRYLRNGILAYVDSDRLNSIYQYIDKYDYKDETKKKLEEAVREYKVADRILSNHDKISKRFNLESVISRHSGRKTDLSSISNVCCELMETYDMKSYQKLNICLEELTFLLDKNGIKFDKAELARNITEYFIMLKKPEDNIEDFKRALTESYCLEDSDVDNIIDIFEREDTYKIDDKIYSCMKEGISGNRDFYNIIKECVYDSSINQLEKNCDKILEYMWNCCRYNVLNVNPEGILENYVKPIKYMTSTVGLKVANGKLAKESALRIANNLKSFNANNIKTFSSTDDSMIREFKLEFSKGIQKCLVELYKDIDVAYNKENIEAISFVESTEGKLLPVSEFKIFKFNNLVTAAIRLDKILKAKTRKFMYKPKAKFHKFVKQARSVLFGENANVLDYVNSDGKVDICVMQIPFEEGDERYLHQLLSSTCKEYNDSLMSESALSTARAYYILNPYIAEVHIKDITRVDLTEEEIYYTRNTMDPSMINYVKDVMTESVKIDMMDSILEGRSFQDMIISMTSSENMTLESFNIMLEAISYLYFDEEDIVELSKIFSDNRSKVLSESVNKKIKADIEIKQIAESASICIDSINTDRYNVPFSIQYEALENLCKLDYLIEKKNPPKVEPPKVGDKLKAGIKDKKDKLANKAESLKNAVKDPLDGININNIKLSIEGLKGKYKEMSQKEKELSRNIDNESRRLVKGFKDAMLSDRREAIIKGSVIPSASRCIKWGIGLAAAGIVTANPTIPIIGALGAFAISKKLTKKERILMLDEIEIELDVLDKEISNAESKNQMKKYRALLKYKKDLQRQYQRIKYNVRVGKDILPNSAAGMRKSDD